MLTEWVGIMSYRVKKMMVSGVALNDVGCCDVVDAWNDSSRARRLDFLCHHRLDKVAAEKAEEDVVEED